MTLSIRRLQSFIPVILIAACIIHLGCSGAPADRPALVPVSGTVVYKGSPVAEATVSFWATGASRPASGVTDAEGKFILSMFEFNDGALPGTNKITVMKVATTPASTEDSKALLENPGALATQMSQATAAKPPKNAIPQKYSSQATSPLTETVSPDGDNTFVLQLSD